MKKILLVALAAAAMVGCSQNEEIDNAAQKVEINFGTVVSSTTRAVVTDLNKLKEAGVGFTVYAYNTGDAEMATVTKAIDMKSFIDGKKATFSTAWDIEGAPYHWPLLNKIQFFALGNPGTATLSYNVPTDAAIYPSFTYTVADVDNQTDLVVAKVLNANQKDNKAGVSLPFTHALAQVNFTVKSTDEYTYKVKSIEISGVSNTGTYNFSTDKWTNLSGTGVSYKKTYAEGSEIVASAEGVEVNTAWMLMPQTMPTSADVAALKITYGVYVGSESMGPDVVSTIDLKGTTAWAVGKKIRYTLSLSYAGAEIKFIVPEIGAWNTNDDENVEK